MRKSTTKMIPGALKNVSNNRDEKPKPPQKFSPKKASAGKVTTKKTRSPPSLARVKKAARTKSPTTVMNTSLISVTEEETREESTPKRMRGGRHKNRETFPVKLFNLLESGNYKEAVSWSEDGEAFVIKDRAMFEKILPMAGFSHHKLRSFHRQCSYWCFQRCGCSTTTKNKKMDTSASSSAEEEWYHPSFFKGMSRLSLTSIVRTSFKGHCFKRGGVTIFLKESGETKGDESATSSSSSSLVSARARRSTDPFQVVLPRKIDFTPKQEQESGDVSTSLHTVEENVGKQRKNVILNHIGCSILPEPLGSYSFTCLDDSIDHQDLDFLTPMEATFGYYVDEESQSEVEMEDILRTLPINDTGTESTDDEEDCLSLYDFFSIADQVFVGELQGILTAAV